MVEAYPDFPVKTDQISKFIFALDFFTILLKDGSIIHYTPPDKASFMQWLLDNHIQNIR